jgi:hypothetical protein
VEGREVEQANQIRKDDSKDAMRPRTSSVMVKFRQLTQFRARNNFRRLKFEILITIIELKRNSR